MDLLQSLNLQTKNSGASTNAAWWSKTQVEGEIISINPATEKKIASVYRPSADD